MQYITGIVVNRFILKFKFDTTSLYDVLYNAGKNVRDKIWNPRYKKYEAL